MLTARDIEEYPLEKSLGGYKTESVDSFLDKVAADYQKLADDNAALSKKITVLVESINKYRQDEDYIKSTLIESQKLAASTIAKANEDAEVILAEANAKAESVMAEANAQAEATVADANAQAEAAVAEAERKVGILEEYFDNLQQQVDGFRNHLLATYKAHIEAISELPVYEKPEEVVVEEEPEEAEEAVVEEAAEEAVEVIEEAELEDPAEEIAKALAASEAVAEDDEELLEEIEEDEESADSEEVEE